MSDFSTPDPELARLEKLAGWLDSRFRVPGTRIRFGFDGILGLIPGVGDTVGAALTAWLIRESSRYGLPWRVRARMLWNLFIDWLVGLIPLVGDIFDIGWKANRKNVELLLNYRRRQMMVTPARAPVQSGPASPAGHG